VKYRQTSANYLWIAKEKSDLKTLNFSSVCFCETLWKIQFT
jgi:hypothetical protein